MCSIMVGNRWPLSNLTGEKPMLINDIDIIPITLILLRNENEDWAPLAISERVK